jgi:hypothetical protein
MTRIKSPYTILFPGFLLSIVLFFSFTRPLNSPWHRFVVGDGFGYYSYLPAKYIYNDVNYEFKWFNKVYADNYIINTGGSADDNFLVKYKDRRINKYYQGLSLLWLPFFSAAHMCAKLLDYPADGFSQPYQIGIGIASLFYLFLGLFFLRKLLWKLFNDEAVANLVPILLFYGTWLYHNSLDLNSYTHVYSFAMIILFIFYSYCFLNESRSVRHLLLSLLCLVIIVCIRPINVLAVLMIPAILPKLFFRNKIKLFPINIADGLIILLMLLFLANQFSILVAQTGSFFPDTYSNEKFYFAKPKITEVLFSYRGGLFLYAPVIFIAMFGILFSDTNIKKLYLLLVFLLVVYIYSSWWCWPIAERSLIDYYVIPAILLASLLHRLNSMRRKIALVFLFSLAGYHQLKNLQINTGILAGTMTYSEIFWRNFFRTRPVNLFAIPPATILKTEVHNEDFEGNTPDRTGANKYGGKYSIELGAKKNFSPTFEYKVPAFMKENGVSKIRFSFRSDFSRPLSGLQAYLTMFDKDKKQLNAFAFYVNDKQIRYGKWDLNEFGYEFGREEIMDPRLDHITVFIWNNTAKDAVFIDDVKTEFILTDKSYEILQ